MLTLPAPRVECGSKLSHAKIAAVSSIFGRMLEKVDIHDEKLSLALDPRAGPGQFFRKIFSYPVLLGTLLVLAAFLVSLRFQVDPDTWWHLVVGQHILTVHSFPASETYSFTAYGNEWMAHEWLGEVLLARAAQSGGLRGLMWTLFILAGMMVLLTYYYAWLRCRNAKAAFAATILVLPLLGVWFSLHPQMLGYILLLIALICLEHFGAGRKRLLWFLPLVFLIWVNTHGTFVVGFLVLGIYWVAGLVELRWGDLVAHRRPAAERIQLLAVALVSLLAGCITPYGTRLLTNPVPMMLWQKAITSDLASWQPLPMNIWHGKLFLLLVLLFIVAVVALQPVIELEEGALLLFAVVMTALHARALPLFAIIFAPILARLLSRWIPAYEPAKDHPMLNAVLIGALALGIAKTFPSQQNLAVSVAGGFPVEAVEYLRQHPQSGPMFNDIDFGGYLLYALGPQHRVFIDGRLEIYAPAGVWADYLHLMRLDPDAPRLLEKYHLQSCLVRPGTRLATFLQASPEWRKAYGDNVSALFVRKCLDPLPAGKFSSCSQGEKVLRYEAGFFVRLSRQHARPYGKSLRNCPAPLRLSGEEKT